MVVQDWLVPAILAATIMDLGVVWALRIRRHSRRSPAADHKGGEARPRLQRVVAQIKTGGPLLIGGAATLASTRLLNPMLIPELRWTAAPFMTVGGLLVLSAAYPLAFRRRGGGKPALWARLTGWLGLRPTGLLSIGAALAFALLAAQAANFGIQPDTQKLAAVCWGLGILLFVLGVSQVDGEVFRPSPRLILGLAGLTSLAFLVRGTATSSIPYVLTGDESLFALASVEVLKGKATNLFASGPHLFPTLFLYGQALPILILGNTAQAIRILSALAGALTVSALYMLGRSMFGHRAGLLAAIFLAFSHFHIHFSRLGFNNIWDGLWYVLVLGAVWHGWKTGRRSSYILAGLTLGLSQYFYMTSRLLLLIVPVWLVIAFVLDRRRFVRALPDLLLMGLMTVVVTLPLAWFYVKNPDVYFGLVHGKSLIGPWLRAEEAMTGMPPGLILARQIIRGFLAYISVPLNAWYRPGIPLLQGGATLLFVVGLVVLIWKYRDARGAMLGLWLVTLGLVGGLSESTPAAQRLVPAAPAAALVIGMALSQAIRTASRGWPSHTRLVASIAFAISLWIGARDIGLYFFVYTPTGDFDTGGALASQHIANYLRGNPEVDQVIFFGNERDPAPNPNLAYLAPQIGIVRMVSPWGSADNPRPSGERLLFAFMRGTEANLPLVQADYPGGEVGYGIDRHGKTIVAMYEAPGSGP